MDDIFTFIGLIISSLFLVWIVKTFIPVLFITAITYFTENKILTTVCLFITVAVTMILHIKEEIGALIVFIFTSLIILPWFFAIIALMLEILKSPYSDFFGDIYFKYKEASNIGIAYFIIGYIVFVVSGLIFFK